MPTYSLEPTDQHETIMLENQNSLDNMSNQPIILSQNYDNMSVGYLNATSKVNYR
jgi:hypothetical protein